MFLMCINECSLTAVKYCRTESTDETFDVFNVPSTFLLRCFQFMYVLFLAWSWISLRFWHIICPLVVFFCRLVWVLCALTGFVQPKMKALSLFIYLRESKCWPWFTFLSSCPFNVCFSRLNIRFVYSRYLNSCSVSGWFNRKMFLLSLGHARSFEISGMNVYDPFYTIETCNVLF